MQKTLDQEFPKLDWGTTPEHFSVVNWDDFVADVKNGKTLIAVAGVIHDV